MSDLDHGEFPIAVPMTSQLFHTLLVTGPDHIQLLPPTSSNHDVHEYDGIHTPPNMSHDIVVNTNGHNDASPPNGKFTSPYRTLVSSSNSRSQCTCPHSSTSDSRSQCLHAHSPSYNSSSKRRSVTPLQHGVPLMCHVMVPCSDPEVTYRRDDGPHTEHFTVCCCQGVIIILPLKMFGESSKTEIFTPILINTENSYYMYIVIKTQIELQSYYIQIVCS